MFILFGREDEAAVVVLASEKVAFNGRHAHRQELIGFVDGFIVRFSGVIGE